MYYVEPRKVREESTSDREGLIDISLPTFINDFHKMGWDREIIAITVCL